MARCANSHAELACAERQALQRRSTLTRVDLSLPDQRALRTAPNDLLRPDAHEALGDTESVISIADLESDGVAWKHDDLAGRPAADLNRAISDLPAEGHGFGVDRSRRRRRHDDIDTFGQVERLRLGWIRQLATWGAETHRAG